MKNRVWVGCVVCLTIMALMLMVFPFKAQAQEMKLRYSVIWPPMHPLTKLMEEWGKDVE